MNSTANGVNSTASADNSTAIGKDALASAANAAAIGGASRATNSSSTALGQGATASGVDSTAVGQNSSATGDYSVSTGRGGRATGYGSLAQGTSSQSSGYFSTAAGTDSLSSGDYSTSLGQSSKATGYASTSLGQSSRATNDRGTAIGNEAGSFSNDSSAFGSRAAAGGNGGATFFNENSTALGAGAQAGAAGNNQANATAVGQGAAANAARATALGQGASATAADSVAIGQGSLADVANTVSVGSFGKERRVLNVAAGTLTVNGTDAVNGAQLYTTNENVTTLIGRTTIVEGRIGTVESQVDGIDNRVATAETNITTLQGQVSSSGIGFVRQDAATRLIGIGAATDGTLIDVSGTQGARSITGLAEGVLSATSSDAVTGSQLFRTEDRIDQAFARVDAIDTDVGNLDTQVTALATAVQFFNASNSGSGSAATVTGANSLALGSGAGSSGDSSIVLGDSSSDGGQDNVLSIGSGGLQRRIINVAEGAVAASSSEAIIGSQLFATNTALIDSLGGSASMAADGTVIPPVFIVQGMNFSNVSDALTQLDQQTTSNTDNIAALRQAGGGGGTPLVSQASSSDPITVGSMEGGTSVDFAGTDGPRTLTGLADGTVTTTSKDAVNGSQFHSAQASVASALGGRARVNSTGDIVDVSYRVNGNDLGDVASAIGSLDGTVSGLQKQISGLQIGGGTPAYLSAKTLRSNAEASGSETSAFGGGATASGENATAVGSDTRASAARASSFGAGSRADAEDATAIGSGANASHARSAAFGAGASTQRGDQIALGTTSSTYTTPGIASNESRAAQSGPVRVVTADTQGNLATADLGSFFPDIEGLETGLQQHQERLGRHSDGIAIALALGGAYLPSDKDYAVSGNLGAFDGSMAMGFAGIGRVSDNVFVNAGVGIGFEETTVAGRAGLTFAW